MRTNPIQYFSTMWCGNMSVENGQIDRQHIAIFEVVIYHSPE